MRLVSKIVSLIDSLNNYVGRAVAWITLVLVLVQFTIVIMRYVFAVGSIPWQETIWYMHGIIFMLGAGYTLLRDGHVRVDVIYREASQKTKAWVNLGGVTFLLMPVCFATWWLSWSYVTNSWSIFESSTETSGLPLIYLLKTVILVFVALISLQGASLGLKSWLVLYGKDQQAAAGG